MVNTLNSLYQSFVAGVSAFLPHEDSMHELPAFGAEQWKVYLGIEVAGRDIPLSAQAVLESPCPYTPNKLIKETHMLCLVPEGLTLDKLRECMNNPPHPYSAELLVPETTYWILITKMPIPHTERKLFEQQCELIAKEGYSPPKALEVAIAILAAKLSGNVALFAQHNHYTKCREEVDGRPLVVSFDAFVGFNVARDIYLQNGLAGVKRIS